MRMRIPPNRGSIKSSTSEDVAHPTHADVGQPFLLDQSIKKSVALAWVSAAFQIGWVMNVRTVGLTEHLLMEDDVRSHSFPWRSRMLGKKAIIGMATICVACCAVERVVADSCSR